MWVSGPMFSLPMSYLGIKEGPKTGGPIPELSHPQTAGAGKRGKVDGVVRSG